MDDELGLETKQAFVMGHRLAVSAFCFVILKVAEMVREECVAFSSQSEGCLQLTTQRQDRHRTWQRELDRRGRVASRPPQRQLAPRDDPCHRIVAAEMNRPVVRQEEVGDAGQPRDRVFVLVGDRLIGRVAAGHDQRLAV